MSATSITKPATVSHSLEDNIARLWRGLIGTLAGVTAIALALYLISALTYRNQTFIGAFLTPTGVINAATPTRASTWPALEAALQANDRIVTINNVAVASGDAGQTRAIILEELVGIAPGEQISVEYVRPGSEACPPGGDTICAATFTTSQLPNEDFLAFFLLPFGSAVAMLALGLLILRYRSNDPVGLMGATIAMTSAVYAGGIFDVGTTGSMTPLWLMSSFWLGASLITFTAHFPRRLTWIRRYPIVKYVPLAAATALGALLVLRYLNPGSAYETQWPQNATSFIVVSLFITLGLAFLQRSLATTPATRDQSNTIFIGVALLILPALLWFLGRLFLVQTGNSLNFQFESLVPLYIFPTAAVAYAVLQYPRDTDTIISRSITYLVMLGALIISVFLLALGSSLLALDLMDSSVEVLPFSLILFVMLLAFTPIRTHLQERIDAIYFRGQRNFQAQLEGFTERLTWLEDYDVIVNEFRRVLDEGVNPTNVFIFLRNRITGDYTAYADAAYKTDITFQGDSQLVKFLLDGNSKTISLQPGENWPFAILSEQPRLQLLKTRLVIGMSGAETLNGFVLVGPPRSGEVTYNHTETQFMENLTGQLAIVTERSQVIDSLQRRVRELDVLSQVGQAVNFTLEFDDLLELIYAQTMKLVPAPHFYIALYDERLNQMYFAFFLEGDDRLAERENRYWDLDLDIFSEVVRSSTALRMSHFQRDLKAQNLDGSLISDETRVFMAMPLLAGRSSLGVIGMGRTESEPYNDDQFKIFNDISALAATSLDKFNLFDQTRIRERQLTVLNDISRQLVATESDVEKLLQIIVESAVEILDAEAGSLLLMADDDSGDLVFRVVDGGGGEELVGKRVLAGEGIVGSVVANGQHIIVNNAQVDERHTREVTENFVSQKLLAVPLIAKNDVIGVLEVINKKDGTVFFEEDAALLTTFAGQAAVAIENARLFQLTDQQLTQRVRELEVLERLDSDLNRTRDLQAVAEITVRTSMNVLRANAGLLGIVHIEDNILEVVAIRGYSEEEYPPEADGLLWPLQYGVVKRVLRNRQPDIIMNLAQDPDYDGGLANSNSQITIPMLSGTDINAVLILEKNTLPRFSLPDWDFAKRIAEHASIALENAQFFAALEMANKGTSEFMGFAAHELKNPLASVKGYADVLVSGMTGDLSERQTNFLNVIKSNAERMERIISDLRDAAKLDAKEFTVTLAPMNIRRAVIETLRPFARTLEEKNQELVNNVPETLPQILGDETRLIQVLTNFISNATKYSHADTTITITGEYVPNFVTQNGEQRGPMVQISVADQGLGMSEEDQKKLFRERYFRSSNQEAIDKEGTGLGMVLSKNIIDQHQGAIWVESELDKGSTFYIAVPIAPEEQTKSQSRRPQAEPASD